MDKQAFLDMDYQIVKNSDEHELDTLFKVFESGNMWIVQFNEEFQNEPIGKVYLTKQQAEQLRINQ